MAMRRLLLHVLVASASILPATIVRRTSDVPSVQGGGRQSTSGYQRGDCEGARAHGQQVVQWFWSCLGFTEAET